MAWRTREVQDRELLKILQHATEESTCFRLRRGSELGLEGIDS